LVDADDDDNDLLLRKSWFINQHIRNGHQGLPALASPWKIPSPRQAVCFFFPPRIGAGVTVQSSDPSTGHFWGFWVA